MARLAAAWRRLPTILQAVLLGFVVTGAGTIPWAVLSRLNFRISPSLPWSVPLMVLYLWLYWRYLGGRGWPPDTAEYRRTSLRAASLSRRVWGWSLVAFCLGWGGLNALVVIVRIALKLPEERFPDVSDYSPLMVVSYILMLSLVAGIAEEAGFRGYMQGPIERRHGPLVALLATGTAFWVGHSIGFIGHWRLFFGAVWYYLGAATILGLLAYLTRSIVPAIVAHSVGDAVQILWRWMSSSRPSLARLVREEPLFWIACTALIVFVPAAFWGYRRLGQVAAADARPPGSAQIAAQGV